MRLVRPALFVLALGSAAGGAVAHERDDHDRARAAVQAGEALPLPALLERLQRERPGRALDVELERDDGRWRYEIRWLEPDGRLVKLEVDAKSGAVLRERRRGRDR